ncbi:PREDICTED: B2 bradykinin receptor-like [Cyprinodon variegatus]|uniref:B2 bradykinin receptor-like n=1 Tax=Cyprinodon variegatus TaxID=28743 RepID=UPI00074268D7|nr:PREDICTED: B2 bradykinin receptor-like [Cyprinodon variegatus]
MNMRRMLLEQILPATQASASSENTSYGRSDLPDTPEWQMIYTIAPPYILILSILGLLFNSFVLAVFVAQRDHLTVAEIYLSNLALADFLLLCGLPFWAMNILNKFEWSYGDAMCKLINSIIVINYYTSIYTLVMISIDRYLALVKTMKARWLRRKRYAKMMCFILWLLGLFLSLPTMIHRKIKFIDKQNTTACILDYANDSPWKFSHQNLMNVVGFVLPILVIVFSSWNIIKALSQRMENAAFHDFKDTKAMVLIFAVMLLFLLCWFPFQVLTLLDTLCDLNVLDETLWSNTLDIGSQVSIYLGFLNSMLNPLLYVFSGHYFKRKVNAIYRRVRHQRRGSDMTTYQRSVVSTYVNRTEQIRHVVLLNPKDHIGL